MTTFIKNLLKVFLVIFIVSITRNSFAVQTAFYIDNSVDGSRILKGHTPSEIKDSQRLTRVDHKKILHLQVILPLLKQNDLDNLLKILYDPASPVFHKFLTPTQFNDQFGLTDQDIVPVTAFLASHNLTVTGHSPSRSVLNVAGSVKDVEDTFKLHFYNYRKNSDKTEFYAPDTDPTIHEKMVDRISAIANLTNLPMFKSFSHRSTSQNFNAKMIKPMFGSGLGCNSSVCLAPIDVKKAYNLLSPAIPVISDPTTLQNIALFELDGYLLDDIYQYEAQYKIPLNSVQINDVLVDGVSAGPSFSGGNAEVTLDIEELIGIGYGSINSIYVYKSGNTQANWNDEWIQIANDSAKYNVHIVSCSWGQAEVLSSEVIADKKVFEQMAAQGQEVFVASGDSGAFVNATSVILSPNEPSTQPFATGVGISKLAVDQYGNYLSESASSNSGGGVSGFNIIPVYQFGMALKATPVSMVSTTMRNAPDVSLTADSNTPYSFFISLHSKIDGTWMGMSGSSIAAPVWAAFMAQVNQGRVSAGNSILGFVNPALYTIAQGINYPNDFHDIISGNNGYYPAQPGLDNATGLGSFNGGNLYKDLLAYSTAPTIPLPPFLVAASGNNSAILAWGVSAGAVSYNVQRSSLSSGGLYTTIANIAANAPTGTTYTDALLQNGTTYYYVVNAVNPVGTSANSNQVQVTPGSLPTPPTGLITSVNRSSFPNSLKVNLQWSPVLGATGYTIRRGTTSGTYTASFNTTYPFYTNNISGPFPSSGITYYYVVATVSVTGTGANSNEISLYIGPPPVPTNLSAIADNEQITLTWKGNVLQTQHYIVERWTTDIALMQTVAYPSYPTFTDTAVTNGTTYNYAVQACGLYGCSPLSSQVSATPHPPPPVISNGQPSGDLPGIGKHSSILSVTTNEPASCRYDTRPNMAYASMAYTMINNANFTYHTSLISGLTVGTYTYYVRCQDQDSVGNVDLSDYIINFEIIGPAKGIPVPLPVSE